MEYASNAKGNLGVTLGAVGTGLGLLDGGANLLGRMVNGGGMSSDDKPVTRYELGLVRESIDQKIENSYLKGQLETADKLAGIQKQFTEQVGFNATVAANVSAVANQAAALRTDFDRLTRVFVPNDNVAPGWGRANVQPAPPLPPYPYGWPFPFPPAPFPSVTPPSTDATTTTTSNG